MDWIEFFEEYPKQGQKYKERVLEVANNYPDGGNSVVVRWADIDHNDMDAAEHLEIKPDRMFELARKAISETIMAYQGGVDNGIDDMRIHLRVEEAPSSMRVPIRDIRQKNLNHLIVVEGLAKRVTEVRPKAIVAAWVCARCNHISMVPQPTPLLTSPLECVKDEGGCGRVAGSTKFEYVMEKSVMIDSQKVEIQERPEGLRGGSQPQSTVAHIYDDLTGLVSPGDKIIITGIHKATPKRSGKTRYSTHDIFLDTNNIELVDVETEDIEISDEERRAINKLKKDPYVLDSIVDSIAPAIYGYGVIKKGLALQMFGGVTKAQAGGTRLRGDIHTLLIGDPGTAKTQLLRHMSSLVPRSIYTSGKSSTAAGLTACATKDEFGEGKWTLEAGVLVLADGGLACVDELDKMSPQDRSAMHEAMEQQTISVAKASIRAQLQSRCAVLGAANPKLGRFSDYDSIADQLDLPSTLITRFDLIFPIADRPDADLDEKVAEHILKAHLAGQVKKRVELEFEVEETAAIKDAMETIKPAVEPELLRKYIFEARKIIPVMTLDAMEELKVYYLRVRKMGEREDAPVPITARQLEGLIRLSEASAKSRMSEEVTTKDAQVAIEITNEFLERVIGRDSEAFDIDALAGVPKSQADAIRILGKAVNELSKEGAFTFEEFMGVAKEHKIEERRAEKVWEHWRQRGDIYPKSVVGIEKWMKVT